MYYINDIDHSKFKELFLKLKPEDFPLKSEPTPNAITITLKANQEILGVAMGMPLEESSEKILNDFSNFPGNLSEIFVISDLHTKDAATHLKKNLLNSMESLVRDEGRYKKIAISSSILNIKPKGVRLFDHYWTKRGYQKHLAFGREPLVYWLKTLYW